MKFPKLFKRAAAVLMAAVTTLSVLPATTAFAAGDIGTISFTHTYDRNGNAIRYNSSDVFDGYTAGGAGQYHYRMYVDGDTAFCIQPGVPLRTGNTLQKNSSETWNALSANQKKAVGLALLYGYQGNRGSLPGICNGMQGVYRLLSADKPEDLQCELWLKLPQQRGCGGLQPDRVPDEQAQHHTELYVGRCK